MTAFPLPSQTAPGEHVHEGGGRLINGYARKLSETAGTKFAIVRVPGMTQFATSSNTGFRGMKVVGANLYSAWASASGKVYRSSSAGGAMTALTGNLPGTAQAFWAANNAATPDVVAVVPGEGAFTVTTTAVTSFADLDVGQPNACCFHKDFIIFTYGNAEMRSTEAGNVSINALSSTFCNYKRDTLYRPMSYKGQLIAWGSESAEFYGGLNETGFPFSFLGAMDIGLVGPYAATGDDDGFDGGVHFVGSDFRVRRLEGWSSVPVSTPDIERLIAAVADKTTIKASCYVANGMPIIVIASPTWTWELNLSTGLWNERASYLTTLWRGMLPHKAFDKWICGDSQSGNLYEIDVDNHEEAGEPLRLRVETGPMGNFPQAMRVERVELYITTGVGIATGSDPDQTDPDIECFISPDGGYSWRGPRLAKLGRQAVMSGRVAWNNMGHAHPHGIRLRFDISGAVTVGVMGGDLKASVLR